MAWNANREEPMRASLKLLGIFFGCAAPFVFGADPAPSRPADHVVKLAPYNVGATFPAIRVRFVLSRKALFDPTADPIVEARVSAVEATAADDETELKPGDVLTALNGTPLGGLTIRQVAALVETARGQGNLVWSVRRGLETVEILHNGDWQTPLLGLTH